MNARHHLFFDLDGTLVDSREGIVNCIRHALEILGVPVPATAEIESGIGVPLQQELARLVGDDRFPSALQLYRERYERIGIFEQKVYPGVLPTLARLTSNGFLACIVTSKPTVYARRVAEYFGLAPQIADIYGSPLTGDRGKEYLIRDALASERIGASDALMIGDRRHDVEGARANGVACLGVSYGFGSRQELVAAGATKVCDDPSALYDDIVAACGG